MVGGAGAIGRFVVDREVGRRFGGAFPYGTLVINLSGSFLLGLVTGLALSIDAALIIGTATIGSYTTFSTWMFETDRLAESGALAGRPPSTSSPASCSGWRWRRWDGRSGGGCECRARTGTVGPGGDGRAGLGRSGGTRTVGRDSDGRAGLGRSGGTGAVGPGRNPVARVARTGAPRFWPGHRARSAADRRLGTSNRDLTRVNHRHAPAARSGWAVSGARPGAGAVGPGQNPVARVAARVRRGFGPVTGQDLPRTADWGPRTGI